MCFLSSTVIQKSLQHLAFINLFAIDSIGTVHLLLQALSCMGCNIIHAALEHLRKLNGVGIN